MGTKLNGVIFNPHLVSPEEISIKLLNQIKTATINALKKEKQHISQKTPSVFGSYFLEFTKPNHKYPMQMIFQRSCEESAEPFFSQEMLAKELSLLFKDIPFIYIYYHSFVSTGGSVVYQNGKSVKETNGNEGDGNKNIGPVFQEYFHIPYKKNKAWNIIDAWLDNCYYYSQFNKGSYPFMKFHYNSSNEDNIFKEISEMSMNAVNIFRNNPSITREEYKNIKKRKISYSMGKTFYKNYIYYVNQTYTSRYFALTEGNLFSKNGLYFLDKPREIQPNEWFKLETIAKEDLERRKNENFGERPASYTLTDEELNRLSYQEQKETAYKRYEIARKRGDNISFNSIYDNFFTKGIKIQAPFQKGDYIVLKDGSIGKVEFLRFKNDFKNKKFIESANIIRKNENSKSYFIIEDLDDYKKIDIKDVPENYLINDEKR